MKIRLLNLCFLYPFSRKLFLKIRRERTVTPGAYLRDRGSGLSHISHLKHSTNMETCRLVKENFTKSVQFEFLLVQIFCIASSNVDIVE